MSLDMSITAQDLDRSSARFHQDRAHVIAKNAATSVGIRAAARVPEAVGHNGLGFDIEIVQGERCDQERSGRCWMFASLNVMRQRVIERLNLKTLELSQTYPLFFDKLEKANWFLASMITCAHEPLDGRLVHFLLQDPVADGGQWDMFRALIHKYGVVTKDAMPETACSRNTREMDAYLTRYLRGCAARIRTAAAEGADGAELDGLRETMMADVYSMLVTCLGEPPKAFDVHLRDKDGKLALSGTFTPQEFLADVIQLPLARYVSIISANTPDKPFGRDYAVSFLGNVVPEGADVEMWTPERGGVRYLNVPIERMKELAVTQLKGGRPVWFGCDVSQSYLRDEGIMDTETLAVDELFGFAVEGCLDRAARLAYGESMMTHAMVLEGVNLDDEGHPTLWKVENSWGKDHGRDGFDTITDRWFDQYVYQIVVDSDLLTEAERAALGEEPILLAPWDPMGALAR